MTKRLLTSASIPGVLVLVLASCGGKGGKAVQPQDFTASNAMGGPPPVCTGEPKLAKPLVVDIDPDARVGLEASLKKGSVVVVAYDCVNVRVLDNCTLADKIPYEYAGTSRKEQVVQMTGADDVKVNLPLSSGKLGGEVSSGRSIDLGLVYVGRRSTVVGRVAREQLTGTCDGATHFISNATVGAFAMSTGSAGKVAAVGDLFGIGASAKSESARKASSGDGSLDSCRTSNPDAADPPAECRSPLRIELVPVVGSVAAAADATKPASGKSADAKSTEEKPGGSATGEANPCRDGYHFADGVCTKAETKSGYLCELYNETECKAQCDKGNPGSCYNYGFTLGIGPAATAAFKKACDLGHAQGCFSYGREIIPEGFQPKDKLAEWAGSIEVFKKGCDLGSGTACNWYGNGIGEKWSAPTYDVKGAFAAHTRGCALGDGWACSAVAQSYLKGEGVAKDVPKGLDFFNRACAGGDAQVCNDFAYDLRFGAFGAPKDPERALKIQTMMCEQHPGKMNCSQRAELLVELGRFDDAFTQAKAVCDANTSYCEALVGLYDTGRGTPRDPAASRAVVQRVCADHPSSKLCKPKTVAADPPPDPVPPPMKAKPKTKPKPKKK